MTTSTDDVFVQRRSSVSTDKKRGVPFLGTPRLEYRSVCDYFSPISLIFTLFFRAAWAAASLAMGTRYGEQLT